MSCTKSRWRPVSSSGSPQGSPLSQVQFNVFLNDLGVGATAYFSKFTDGTKLGKAADSPENCDAMEKGP